MAKQKTYGSKREIYRDYQIAIKFGLDFGGLIGRDYEYLYRKLQEEHGWVAYLFSNRVADVKKGHPVSVGFFIEIPVKGDDGEEIGARLVLLQHETGPEIFIPALITVGTWMGLKALEVVYKKLIEEALTKLLRTLRKLGKEPASRISYVEIRTEKKGAMRMPFSEFRYKHLQCLIKCFDQIKHLSECNEKCFEGKLVDAPKSWE